MERGEKKNTSTVERQQPIKAVKISPKDTVTLCQASYPLFHFLPRPGLRIMCYCHIMTLHYSPEACKHPSTLWLPPHDCTAVSSPCFHCSGAWMLHSLIPLYSFARCGRCFSGAIYLHIIVNYVWLCVLVSFKGQQTQITKTSVDYPHGWFGEVK